MESAHQHTCGRGAIVALIVIAGLSPVACRRPVPPRPSNIVVRLMTGTPGGGFYPVGAELASAFRKGAAPFSIDHRESGGSINNVAALQRGDADVALAYADVAYLSSIGRLEGQKRPFDHLRGMAVLQLAPIHLVVGARSGISDVSRLRGRRIGVGTTGRILRAFGITPAQTRMLRYDQAAFLLARGDLDAMFVIGSDPVDGVRVATAAGARILPLAGVAIDRLRHEYPFFRVALVRRGSYSGQNEPIMTIGVENLLLCREGLSEQVVHDFIGRLCDLQPSILPLQDMDLEHAPAVPIRLHEGAARFYREREVFR